MDKIVAVAGSDKVKAAASHVRVADKHAQAVVRVPVRAVPNRQQARVAVQRRHCIVPAVVVDE
jgi:hypothetical protein